MSGQILNTPPDLPQDLRGPLMKVERAENHARALIDQLDVWRSAPCYRLEYSEHPNNPNRITAKVVWLNEIPAEVPVILGEIFYLLGSALDNVVCALARRQGNSCAGTKFPIRDSPKEFESDLLRLWQLRPEHLEMIRRFRPYKTGDRTLWAIRKLTNRDKHQLLLTVTASQQLRFRAQAQTTDGEILHGVHVEAWNASDPLRPLVVGDTFDLPRPSSALEARLSVFVALNEPGILGSDLVATGSLNLRAIQRVREVILAFRAQGVSIA